MSSIKDWSTTAASNNAAAPNGWPEGMAPSGVNNSARENMAAIREFYGNIEFREFADATGTNDCHTATYASATTFTLAAGDGDVTAIYHAGRRIRVVSATPGTIYGVITSSSHSTVTTVTVNFDSTEMTSEAITVSLGVGVTGFPVFPGAGTDGQHLGIASGLPAWLDGGWEKIDVTQTASASTSLDFTDADYLLDSTYRMYAFVLEKIRPTTDSVDFQIRISQGAGFLSDSTYHYHTTLTNSNSSGYAGQGAPTAGGMVPAPSVGNDAVAYIDGVVTAIAPYDAASLTSISWTGSSYLASNYIRNMVGAGFYAGAAGACDGIRFMFGSGTIADGSITCYGIR